MQIKTILEVMRNLSKVSPSNTPGGLYYTFDEIIDGEEVHVQFVLHDYDDGPMWVFFFMVNLEMVLIKKRPISITLKILNYVLSCVDHVRKTSKCQIFCLQADKAHTLAYSSFLPKLATRFQMKIKKEEGFPLSTFYIIPNHIEKEVEPRKELHYSKLNGSINGYIV